MKHRRRKHLASAKAQLLRILRRRRRVIYCLTQQRRQHETRSLLLLFLLCLLTNKHRARTSIIFRRTMDGDWCVQITKMNTNRWNFFFFTHRWAFDSADAAVGCLWVKSMYSNIQHVDQSVRRFRLGR